MTNDRRPVVIVENDPEVPPGLVEDILQERGVPYRRVRAYEGEPLPTPGETSAAVVLGGTMGVGDTEKFPYLYEVKRFVRQWAEADAPLLGICLGGQLLSEALGAEVISNCHGEKGVCQVSVTGNGKGDPLFNGIAVEFQTFQWHNDSFGLPSEAVLLAGSPDCPCQAIRSGSRVYGLQFHPEVTPAIVQVWEGSTSEGPILADFIEHEADIIPPSRTLLTNFLRIAGLAA